MRDSGNRQQRRAPPEQGSDEAREAPLTPRPGVVDLGRVAYLDALAAMRALANEVARGRHPGAVWLLEHDAVYTAGRGARPGEGGDGEAVVPVERGGGVTFHGPGQLVVYPIVPLAHRDVRRWLRSLEGFGIDVCARFGLSALPSVAGTGVFVGGRKVASIGIAVRGWVSLHGIAINVDVDLERFQRCRPCGLDPAIMTDLSRELHRRVAMAEAKSAACGALAALGVGAL
jgi:lipoyl(octanoyl) transferase